MKTSVKLLSLALVLVMTAMLFVSCGAPNADPDDALAALKENKYVAAKDTVIVPNALKLVGVDGIKCVVSGSATIDDKFETVTIIYFDSKDDANDAWEKVQDYADDKKEDKAESWICKKSGSMIYFGTPNGAKAAK